MAEQFSTFKEDLENIGIHITDEQYSDLCEINLFMKGMPDIPVYNILLILKTLVPVMAEALVKANCPYLKVGERKAAPMIYMQNNGQVAFG